MASAETIPLEALLAPIRDDAPAGANVRLDPDPGSLYYRIKDARAAARAAERQAQYAGEDGETPPIDWSGVLELAPKLLREQAKDLEVAAWWIEALVREHGFAGLRDGFKLIHGLVERYWDELHPQPDEDGIATRLAPLTGLNGDDAEGTLIAPISLVPITAASDSGGPYSAWHYHQANELERVEDREQRERRIAAGAPTMEQFRQGAFNAGAAFYADLREDLAACQAAFAELNAALEARCGSDAPPSSRIDEALARVVDTVSYVAREGGLGDGAPAHEAEPQAPVSEAPAAGAPAQPGVLRTREDALRTLRSVADYYRRAEPHSPIAYLIEQAVRWGNMPLHELIEELIPDTGSRHTYQMMTGIRPPESES